MGEKARGKRPGGRVAMAGPAAKVGGLGPAGSLALPEAPWSQPGGELLERLDVSEDQGLSDLEVAERRRLFGLNAVSRIEHESAWRILADQFRSLIVLMLAVAAGVALALGDVAEAVAIGVVIVINAQIGFWTELAGRRSMEALLKMGEVPCRVLRGGRVASMPAEELVPGDIVVFESGDIVPADVRILRASSMQANESALTGESLPVAKAADPDPVGALVSERHGMLHQGTFVVRGAGRGVVAATGFSTELGRISELVQTAKPGQTPLEKRLSRLGGRLIVLTVIVAAVVMGIGVAEGQDALRMLETAIALAVAAIPEGLPVVATIALASGMRIMARNNAVMTRLSSVETLGATGVICTDKTGTLTENEMTVRFIVLSPDGARCVVPAGGEVPAEGEVVEPPAVAVGAAVETGKSVADASAETDASAAMSLTCPERIIQIASLCNLAHLGTEGKASSGDPLEVALLEAVRALGTDPEAVRAGAEILREEPFDPDVKMMAVWAAVPDEIEAAGRTDARPTLVLVKGAPSIVLERSTRLGPSASPLTEDDRAAWDALISSHASKGLRLLGFAWRREDLTAGKSVASDAVHSPEPAPDATDTTPGPAPSDPYHDLIFLGFAALQDPPRSDVRDAIEACSGAGIRVVMLTGDQPETADYVAREVGLIPPDAVRPPLHGRDLPELADIEAVPSRIEQIVDTHVFARISPRQKLDLIQFHQNRGHVVAMTGDGVNDAPALKKADIGIAMGRRGTQVAMDASDMILRDDAFPTIVLAIREGRIIFRNIRRFIVFLMSCNLSEILVVGAATSFNAALTPLQILFLNLVTDVFPALALGVGRADDRVMERPPRPADEPILTKANWLAIARFAVLITGAVGLSAWLSVRFAGATPDQMHAILFFTLALAQLWHVFNVHRAGDAGDEGTRRRDIATSRATRATAANATSASANHATHATRAHAPNDILRNPWVWAAIALCLLILAAILPFPAARDILSLEPLPLAVWAVIIPCSLLVLAPNLLRWIRRMISL